MDTAAARNQSSERVFVYDLGGGTFDVSLVDIEGREHSVVATEGSPCWAATISISCWPILLPRQRDSVTIYLRRNSFGSTKNAG